MLQDTYDSFNYDNAEDRLGLLEKSWDRSKELVIFDELHKLNHWKSWLKGVYDTEGIPPALVVTGSAKLDTYKKVGDSLAGRFFQFRLHPLDVKEIHQTHNPPDTKEVLDTLLENLVACALLKEMHFREDCLGEQWNLHYLRDKDGREIDFLMTRNDEPFQMLEVKWSDGHLSSNFSSFEKYFTEITKIQLVKELKREKTYRDGAQIRMAHNWLAGVKLENQSQ